MTESADQLEVAVEIVGIVALVLFVVLALGLLLIGVRELPSLRRYMRMRKM